jgi:hypothetical protein
MLLTALVLLSITPRLFLHNLVANHQHIAVNNNGSEATISATQQLCDCINFVAEPAFLPGSAAKLNAAPEHCTSYNALLPQRVAGFIHYNTPPRAPPAA